MKNFNRKARKHCKGIWIKPGDRGYVSEVFVYQTVIFILCMYYSPVVHAEKGLEQARNATSVLFDGGGVDSLMKLSVEDLEQLFRNAPTTELPISLLGEGEEKMTVTELAVQSGAVDSYRE